MSDSNDNEIRLCGLADELRPAKSEGELYTLILRLTQRETSATWAGVYLVDPVQKTIFFDDRYVWRRNSGDDRTPRSTDHRGDAKQPGKTRDVGWKAGIVGWAARHCTGKRVCWKSKGGEASDLEHDFGGFTDAVVVPLVARNGAFAVLVAGGSESALPESDAALVRAIAAAASMQQLWMWETSQAAVTNRHLQQFFDSLPAINDSLKQFRETYALHRFLPATVQLLRKLSPADGYLILTRSPQGKGVLQHRSLFWVRGSEVGLEPSDDAMMNSLNHLKIPTSVDVRSDLSDLMDVGLYGVFFDRFRFLSVLALSVGLFLDAESVLLFFSESRRAFGRVERITAGFVREILQILAASYATASAVEYQQRTVAMAYRIAAIKHEVRDRLTYIRGDAFSVHNHLAAIAHDIPEGQTLSHLGEAMSEVMAIVNDVDPALAKLELLKRFKWREEELAISSGPCDPNQILRGVAANCAPYAEEKNISIEYQLEESIPTIHSDSQLIEECVSNLLLNAIYFTRRSGRIVLASHYYQSDPLPIWLSVLDEGGGIHKRDQERIFEPFYSTKHTDPNVAEPSGSGIGLFLTRSNARLLGGDVALESVVPSWSKFTLKLPCDLTRGTNDA